MATVVKNKGIGLFSTMIEMEGIPTDNVITMYGDYAVMAFNIFDKVANDLWGISIISSQSLVTEIVLDSEAYNIINTQQIIFNFVMHLFPKSPEFYILFLEHFRSTLIEFVGNMKKIVCEDEQDQINMPRPY